MTIQIFQYDFLGPVKLSEWGPPMEKVVYLILGRQADTWGLLYTDECEKTEENDFFVKNEKFGCWVSKAGREENLYLSIYPMWESTEEQRRKIVDKIVSRYKPPCNDIS